MSSFYDDASLVVIPSGYKTSKVYAEKPTDGSGDLSFTRTGDTATRVNSAGLIEKVRTNYARQSQSFATAAVWTATNGTITNNAGTAPDGTNTASKIVATNTDPFCYQSITLTGPVVASCYVKAVGSAVGKSAEIRAGVSLTTFTLTGSWQRVSVNHTASGAHNYGLEVPNPGVIGDEVLLWGFQVEGGDIATAYIPTLTAAVSTGPTANVPRLDYLGSTCGKLLLEPQRTNLVTYSEQFDNAAWTKTLDGQVTITANTAVSPDGTTSADKMIPSAIAGFHCVQQQVSLSAGSASISVFAKAAEYSFLQIFDALTTEYVNFNLTNGTVGSSDTYVGTIDSLGNGWYRCKATKTVPTGTFSARIGVVTSASAPRGQSFTGNGTNGLFIWGAQLEAGAYATSYIPTLAASATRGVDDATKTSITSLIGQTEGTLFLDFQGGANDSANHFIGFSDGTTGNRIVIVRSSANTLYAQIRVGGVEQALIQTGTLTENTNYKCAVAYKANDVVFYVNGAQVGTDTSATIPATSVFATNTGVSSSYFERAINQSLVFKTRLTNAQLAELTTL